MSDVPLQASQCWTAYFFFIGQFCGCNGSSFPSNSTTYSSRAGKPGGYGFPPPNSGSCPSAVFALRLMNGIAGAASATWTGCGRDSRHRWGRRGARAARRDDGHFPGESFTVTTLLTRLRPGAGGLYLHPLHISVDNIHLGRCASLTNVRVVS